MKKSGFDTKKAWKIRLVQWSINAIEELNLIDMVAKTLYHASGDTISGLKRNNYSSYITTVIGNSNALPEFFDLAIQELQNMNNRFHKAIQMGTMHCPKKYYHIITASFTKRITDFREVKKTISQII